MCYPCQTVGRSVGQAMSSLRYLSNTFYRVPVLLTLCLLLNLMVWNSSNSICLRNSLSVTRQSKINASFDVNSRAKRYLSSRVLYTSKGTSSFSFPRKLVICGNVSENPGPRKRTFSPRFPCFVCKKNVRNHQDAILCVSCNTWSHSRCAGMSKATLNYYLSNPHIDWSCSFCALPQFSDSFFSDHIQDPSIDCTLDDLLSTTSLSPQPSLQLNGTAKTFVITTRKTYQSVILIPSAFLAK